VVSGVFEFTVGDETKVVKAGDTMLKKDGIRHGCVCLEEGILLDIFSPMREDFVK
jgi:quercetin dioxygenase-like cupin family protein